MSVTRPLCLDGYRNCKTLNCGDRTPRPVAYRAPAPFAIVDAVPEFIWRMSAEGRHRCTEDKDIIIKLGTNERKFTGYGLLQNFTLPNFYFHCTTGPPVNL